MFTRFNHFDKSSNCNLVNDNPNDTKFHLSIWYILYCNRICSSHLQLLMAWFLCHCCPLLHFLKSEDKWFHWWLTRIISGFSQTFPVGDSLVEKCNSLTTDNKTSGLLHYSLRILVPCHYFFQNAADLIFEVHSIASRQENKTAQAPTKAPHIYSWHLPLNRSLCTKSEH